MADEFDDRKKLSFEQAEGAAPLPSQLKLKELSQQLRAALWDLILQSWMASSEYPSMGGNRFPAALVINSQGDACLP